MTLMTTRDTLHHLIDRIPEEELAAAGQLLESMAEESGAADAAVAKGISYEEILRECCLG